MGAAGAATAENRGCLESGTDTFPQHVQDISATCRVERVTQGAVAQMNLNQANQR